MIQHNFEISHIIYVSGILNSIKWQPSNKLLRCFHIQSQATKDSLHFKSRIIAITELKSTPFYPSSLQQKRHVSSFPPRFAKLPRLLTFTTCSRQFIHCFCTKSSSNNLQNKTSDLEKDTCKSKLSHVDSQGHAQMVDVGAKEDSNRLAVATAVVYLGPEAFRLVKENKICKGDVLTVAQLAGIMASKLTPNLIPLCHNIHITHAEVNLELDENKFAVNITGSVNSVGRTGVEMESLTAVTVAALTVYDMCKAVSHNIVISDIKLVKKVGGKSGDYVAS